jgi:hypothetical protein
MNHDTAIKEFAVERYTLDEMTSAEERNAFEEHYFECEACWAAVKRATDFADHARVALRKPIPAPKWRYRWPATAAAAAIVVAVGLGPVRTFVASQSQEGLYETVYITADIAREASKNDLPADTTVAISVDGFAVEDAASYRMVLRGPDVVRTREVSPKQATRLVTWRLSPLPPGHYELVIESVDRGGKRVEICKQPINVGGS